MDESEILNRRPWKVIVQHVYDDEGTGRQYVRVRGLCTVDVPVDAVVYVRDHEFPVIAELGDNVYEVRIEYNVEVPDPDNHPEYVPVPRTCEVVIGDGHTIESDNGLHQMSLRDALHEWGRALRGEELQW